MGRVGRQRKYKSVDPSHGTSRSHETDSKFDKAPQEKSDDQAMIPRKMKRMLSVSKVATGKVQAARQKQVTSRKKTLKKQEKSNLQIRPGETRKQFFNRLDSQVGEALNNAMMKTKKLREGRKSHLKKRDEKRKMKKIQNPLTGNLQISRKQNEVQERFPEDQVKFGEVVDEPPQLSAMPRKAKTKQVAPSTMKLAAAFKDKHSDLNEDKKTDKVSEIEMTKNKLMLDELRNKAILEYRKLKHRKNNCKFVTT